MGVADEAAVGIGVGREDQEGFPGRRQQPGHRAAQKRTARLGTVIEQIAPRLVEQAAMDMQAAAGGIAIGLGHEGAMQAEIARHSAHGALQQDGVVGGEQRVGLVGERDLELPPPILDHDAFRRQAEAGAGAAHRRQNGGEFAQFVHRIDARAIQLIARDRRFRRSRATLRHRLAAHQIEFQLEGHHRRVAVGTALLDHRLEDLARIAHERRAVRLEHGGKDLAARLFAPHHRQQRPAGEAHPVAIAPLPGDPIGQHVLAPDIEGEDRARELHSLLVNLIELLARHPLAAQDAIQVAGKDLDFFHGA